MKKFKAISSSLFGDYDQIGSERYFVTITCFVASVFLMILCFVHLIMSLEVAPVFFACGSSLVILIFYLLVRFSTCLFIPKLLLTVFGLIMLDIIWYSKYLSNGPVLFFILIFGALILWVWEGKSLALLLSFYFFNIVVLFLIDYTAADSLFQYPENSNRSLDIYLSFTLYSALLIFLLTLVKKDFIRQKEKAIRSDRLKSAFLSNMSHEIRTPMNAIVGFSELLGSIDNIAEKQQYINIIKTSSNDLLRLINDIIELSKIEAGDMKIIYSEFSIQELFVELKELYTLELNSKEKSGIHLDFLLPDGDITVRSDSLRLRQVLSNLLNNAIKFTSQGSISYSCARKGKELLFSVSDTGTGIPEKDQEKIFERFTNL
jgi:signal transduction histidine kinase